MKILFFIWEKGIPNFLQFWIKYIIFLYKYPNLSCDKSTIKNMDLLFILNVGIKFSVGKNVKIGKNISLKGNIEIGSYSYFNSYYSQIDGSKEYIIKIGKFCSIGRNVYIVSHDFHDKSKLTTNGSFLGFLVKNKGANVLIGNDVWIGANVTILPGITIGNGVIVGAGSIVTKDLPSYSICVGNPAKILKYRFSDINIKKIEKSEWWDWEIDKIKKNFNLEFIYNDGKKM